MQPFCLIEDRDAGETLLFEAPRTIIAAYRRRRSGRGLRGHAAGRERGAFLAGFVAYECGYALEPRLAPLLRPARGCAAAEIWRFRRARPAPALEPAGAAGSRLCAPAWSFADYESRFAACRDYIAAGDVYQINLTFPLSGFGAARRSISIASCGRASRCELGGIVALGGETILSLSPEKFFSTRGETSPRGR